MNEIMEVEMSALGGVNISSAEGSMIVLKLPFHLRLSSSLS
jgi:hypothetical protein